MDSFGDFFESNKYTKLKKNLQSKKNCDDELLNHEALNNNNNEQLNFLNKKSKIFFTLFNSFLNSNRKYFTIKENN